MGGIPTIKHVWFMTLLYPDYVSSIAWTFHTATVGAGLELQDAPQPLAVGLVTAPLPGMPSYAPMRLDESDPWRVCLVYN